MRARARLRRVYGRWWSALSSSSGKLLNRGKARCLAHSHHGEKKNDRHAFRLRGENATDWKKERNNAVDASLARYKQPTKNQSRVTHAAAVAAVSACVDRPPARSPAHQGERPVQAVWSFVRFCPPTPATTWPTIRSPATSLGWSYKGQLQTPTKKDEQQSIAPRVVP